MSINNVTLVGNLGQDPEKKDLPNGNQVVKLRLATTGRRKVGDQWVDTTCWHNVTIFGNAGNGVAKFAKKGDQIGVVGRIDNRVVELKDGTKRVFSEVIANSCTLPPKRASSGPSSGPSASAADADDGIPF